MAVHLWMVDKSLQSLPPDWHDAEVEDHSQKLLVDLAKISTDENMIDMTNAWDQLRELFEPSNRPRLRNAWKELLKRESKERTVFKVVYKCRALVQKCFPFRPRYVIPLPEWVYIDRPQDCSVHFNAGLFAQLGRNVTCQSEAVCLKPVLEQPVRSSQHLSRLCLDSCEGNSRDLSYWQEVCLKITENKIALAYTIALAFWQLYDCDLTKTTWTSENIWFMPQMNLGVQGDHTLSLMSYLTFPFDAECRDRPSQQQSDSIAVHLFPRILSIGIILLEIALSQPFPETPVEDVHHSNSRLQIAKAWLNDLGDKEWDLFESKHFFYEAVEECLGFEILRRQETVKEEFYRKIVCRLAHLLKDGFKNHHQGRAHPKRQAEEPLPLSEPEGAFHTGRPLVQRKWLPNLNSICEEVELKRREHEISTPITVAILDTGCDLSLAFPEEDNPTVQWKDFVEENNDNPKDSYGHGTLMARLVLECSPCAEIIVARIAKDMKGLEGNQSKIAEAIQWAGIDRKANIISMSFGFRKENKAILDAIDKVKQERSVIFLSSAGNIPSENERFPARHHSVTSIYATNYKGIFSDSNPKIEIGNKVVMGTFGDDLPGDICTAFERRFGRNVCQPGSSIATAVAAGIAATMLAYVTVLPKLVSMDIDTVRQLRWMWETAGMEAVLKKGMARPQGEQIQRMFLDPAPFWRDKSAHFTRLCSIVTNLVDLDNEQNLRAELE
ncbi:hypothetical protein N8I77_005001 [Diaporthe amygdali]|uniref:Peptidase S8/S53 domain-containing protein n=1 Tax=Phomopsis amygdali TaxID=1214568 RepID=A0AAD9SNG6_PHOAM|nr:hypothetical protein N8I77_005001 [Diaporthe amygdali]